LATQKKVSAESVKQSWFGLTANEKNSRLWWAGGGDGIVRSYEFAQGRLEPRDTYPAAQPSGENVPMGFRTGVYFDSASGNLLSLTILPKGNNRSLAWGDAASDRGEGGTISRFAQAKETTVTCGKRPYDVLKAANGLLYDS